MKHGGIGRGVVRPGDTTPSIGTVAPGHVRPPVPPRRRRPDQVTECATSADRLRSTHTGSPRIRNGLCTSRSARVETPGRGGPVIRPDRRADTAAAFAPPRTPGVQQLRESGPVRNDQLTPVRDDPGRRAHGRSAHRRPAAPKHPPATSRTGRPRVTAPGRARLAAPGTPSPQAIPYRR